MEESELNIEGEQLHDSLVKDILIDREKESVVIRITTAEVYYPETSAAWTIVVKRDFQCQSRSGHDRNTDLGSGTEAWTGSQQQPVSIGKPTAKA